MQSKRNFCVENDQSSVVRDDRICNYFRPNSKVWDVNRVQQDFHRDDAQLILQTNIPQKEVKDRIAWVHTNTGTYTVKSGYQFWSQLNMTHTAETDAKGWNKLWNLNVPHKIRTFLWRFCTNNVPVRKLLRSRGVNLPITCPICNTDIEHLLHTFFDCTFAVAPWQYAGVTIDGQLIEDAPRWLLDRFVNDSPARLELIAKVLWGIWFARNQNLWEGKVLTAAIAMDISGKVIKEWQSAMARKAAINLGVKKSVPTRCLKWKPPASGFVKINVDASVFSGDPFFTIDMLLRDERGVFIQGKTLKFQGSVSVPEAEARGVHEALTWLEVLGCKRW